MQRVLIPRLAALLAVLAGLLFAAVAQATVVTPLSREDHVRRSDLVVRARVVSQSSAWNQDHSQIVTLTHLQVLEYLKGAGARDLTVRQFGGTVDGRVAHVVGDGHFAPGAEVVAFLRAGDGVVFLTALAQSLYVVNRSDHGVATVRRDLSDLAFAQREGGHIVLAPATYDILETLDQIEQSVRALRGGAR